MSEQMPTKGQLLEQQSAEERIAFSAFKQTYMERVPVPDRPAALNVGGLGLEFWLYFVMAIAAILLAAMRTSDAFYFVGYATAGDVVYASAEAVLSVIVVELGMVVFAAILAQKRYRKQELRRKEEAAETNTLYVRNREVDINSWIIGLGLLLMTLISMAAGLHQSIRIIESVDPKFVQVLSYGLGITIGVGITIIAVISGDIIGQQVAIVTAGFSERAAVYEADMAAYQHELEDAWARSDERRVIRAEVRAAAKSSSVTANFPNFSEQFPNNGGLRRPPKQTERVFQYMDQIYRTEGRVPPFAEVMEVLQIPRATASEARTKWMTERGVTE
jgi:hypothetical protein